MGTAAIRAAKQQEGRQKPRFYRPELDCLRFFAFFGVFLNHTLPDTPSYYVDHHVPLRIGQFMTDIQEMGNFGVDLFFCLSAYLITELLLREISAEGRLDVRGFYIRRALRIWPLYFLATAIAVLIPLIDSQQYFTWKYALAFLFFSGNWIFAFRLHVQTWATPLWSVSVEEQFYLAWPLAVRKASRSTILAVAVGFIALSCITRTLVYYHIVNVDVWHNTFARLDPMGLGAILAVVLNGGAPLKQGWQRIGPSALGLGVIFIISVSQATNLTSPGMVLAFLIVAVSCAAILVSILGITLNVKSSAVNALVYLGKISYGLYVYHFLCIYVDRRVWQSLHPHISPAMGFSIRWLIEFGATVAVAALSYRWIESPFLMRKSRFAHVASRPV